MGDNTVYIYLGSGDPTQSGGHLERIELETSDYSAGGSATPAINPITEDSSAAFLIRRFVHAHAAEGVKIVVSVGKELETLDIATALSSPIPASASSQDMADIGDVRSLASSGDVRIQNSNLYIPTDVVRALANSDTVFDPENAPFALATSEPLFTPLDTTLDAADDARMDVARTHYDAVVGVAVLEQLGSLQQGQAVLIDIPPVQRDLPTLGGNRQIDFTPQ